MLAERHQLYQSSLFNDRFAPTIISNEIDRLYHLYVDLIIPEDYSMFSDSVTFKNIRFKVNDYVILSVNSDETKKCMKIHKFVINTEFDKCLIVGRIDHFFYMHGKKSTRQTRVFCAKRNEKFLQALILL